MFKKIFAFSLFFFILTGCSTCILIQSEYYDVTGKVLVPKCEQEEIPFFTETVKPDKPYREIGMVKVLARWGTPQTALNAELKKRARQAGADALMDVQYGEDKANDLVLCGKLVATKRNQSAIGKAIIFIRPDEQKIEHVDAAAVNPPVFAPSAGKKEASGKGE